MEMTYGLYQATLQASFNHGTVDENSTLYDSSTDTIYIYNDYQLKIIQSDNSENEPVMSQDMLPECVGYGTTCLFR